MIMDIKDNIQIIDLALSIDDTLIISDLHIGYEEEIRKRGTLIPKFQFNDLKKRLNYILEQTNPKHIIINGDLKHEFGTISEQEWWETTQILKLLAQNNRRITLIKGNHDTILEPIAKKQDIEIVDQMILNDILIIHGDRSIQPDKNIKTIIVGHMHPAITLRQGPKSERYKCFLKGKYSKKDLIIMPSFHELTTGYNILEEDSFGLLKDRSISGFEVFIVGEDHKVYGFGRLKDIPD